VWAKDEPLFRFSAFRFFNALTLSCVGISGPYKTCGRRKPSENQLTEVHRTNGFVDLLPWWLQPVIHILYYCTLCWWLSGQKTWSWMSGITYTSVMLRIRPTLACLSPCLTDWKRSSSGGTQLICVLLAKILCPTIWLTICTIMLPFGPVTGQSAFFSDIKSMLTDKHCVDERGFVYYCVHGSRHELWLSNVLESGGRMQNIEGISVHNAWLWSFCYIHNHSSLLSKTTSNKWTMKIGSVSVCFVHVCQLTLILLHGICRSKWPCGIRANGHLLLNSEKVLKYIFCGHYLFIVCCSWSFVHLKLTLS